MDLLVDQLDLLTGQLDVPVYLGLLLHQVQGLALILCDLIFQVLALGGKLVGFFLQLVDLRLDLGGGLGVDQHDNKTGQKRDHQQYRNDGNDSSFVLIHKHICLLSWERRPLPYTI